MKALLIEDEPGVAKAIELILMTEGFDVYSTDLGEEGIDFGKICNCDIILLDLNLPDMSGHTVLKRLRAAGVNTPVLILTGNTELDSKISSFGLGADDYVTKPFNRDELTARIHAILRRSRGQAESVVCFGGLTVNLSTKTADFKGAVIPLTGKEFAMLELMALHKDKIMTKEMFLNHLYDSRDEPASKIIDVFICKLRRKLADGCRGLNFIDTVWGEGYRMPEREACNVAA